MLLTPAELESLTAFRSASPHSLLGLHPLGNGLGLAGRALIPGAVKVRIVPVHDRTRPAFELHRIGDTDLFEGSTRGATSVYAYDLEVTWADGSVTQGRDPYSFWPTLGETDLHLFNEGNHRRLYDALGAQKVMLDGVPGVAFSVWAPSARRVSVVGSFNGWDGRRHAMRQLGASGVWEIFVPGLGDGALYKYEIHGPRGERGPSSHSLHSRRPRLCCSAFCPVRTHSSPCF
jgi:1,4-alpha-glucan branching enzyme